MRRPHIEVSLPQAKGRRVRRLLADTGAGSDESPFELLLIERDCIRSGGLLTGAVSIGGAYAGWFNVYSIDVRISALNYLGNIEVVGVPKVPGGFDGIACFKFLNRFHFGNFGDSDSFGLG
jgi:hypothetical protein